MVNQQSIQHLEKQINEMDMQINGARKGAKYAKIQYLSTGYFRYQIEWKNEESLCRLLAIMKKTAIQAINTELA